LPEQTKRRGVIENGKQINYRREEIETRFTTDKTKSLKNLLLKAITVGMESIKRREKQKTMRGGEARLQTLPSFLLCR
jgi:hypothetical protein